MPESSLSAATPLRLAVVWGATAALLFAVAVVLVLWTTLTTDSGLLCSAPYGGSAVACRLYDAWLPVLAVTAVFAAGALLAGVVGLATRGGRPSGGRRS